MRICADFIHTRISFTLSLVVVSLYSDLRLTISMVVSGGCNKFTLEQRVKSVLYESIL